MFPHRLHGGLLLLGALLSFPPNGLYAAEPPCSLLTPAEIEQGLKAKVAKVTPSTNRGETACEYQVGKDKLILSYYANPNAGPKATSIKEDPFLKGLSPGPYIRDFGNIGCRIMDGGVLFNTNCNRYQPRWLHIAIQTHAPAPIPIDAVKALLEKAARRFR